jgi:hypothetical protein
MVQRQCFLGSWMKIDAVDARLVDAVDARLAES